MSSSHLPALDVFGRTNSSVFRTYTTTRDLNLLYFDGIAHVNVPGSFDLQDMIAFGLYVYILKLTVSIGAHLLKTTMPMA